jgi:folate-dependent phosphoribosylglycinamide formyltransferase PurN
MTKRLIVFASDKGLKLQAILDACANGTIDAEVVALVADKKCPAIHVAEEVRIPIIFHIWGPYKVKKKLPETYKRDLAAKVWMYQPDLMVLAGWVRELAGGFLENYPRQVVSVHPSLPGAFPGAFALAEAYDAFQQGEIQHTGVTVNYAMGYEIQPEDVITQENVPIFPDESLEDLRSRSEEVEARLLINALANILKDK